MKENIFTFKLKDLIKRSDFKERLFSINRNYFIIFLKSYYLYNINVCSTRVSFNRDATSFSMSRSIQLVSRRAKKYLDFTRFSQVAHELSPFFHPENVSYLMCRGPLLRLADNRPTYNIAVTCRSIHQRPQTPL